MTENQKPKETSNEYGKSYQEQMLVYYRKSKEVSESNTEYLRVVLANDLVKKHALPRFVDKPADQVTVVDIGCSVGLFAIEFSKQGFRSVGVDFDAAALEIAAKLNEEEGAKAQFYKMDVSDWDLEFPIDIAICFDIFEHLHDDELGSLLTGIKKKLSQNGCIVFHTLPMEYDYLFWNGAKGRIRFPFFLQPFKYFGPIKFYRLVRLYAMLLDGLNIARGRGTHKEDIKLAEHCNPLMPDRLVDIFERAGYRLIFMETGFLGDVQLDPPDRKYFYKHSVTHRSLCGVAVPRHS